MQALENWDADRPTTKPPEAERIAELEAENAELREENRKLTEMVRFLRQYAPR